MGLRDAVLITKKKGDKVPEENRSDHHYKYPSVEKWMNDKELWNRNTNVYVQLHDFIVDREDGCLYVQKTAMTAQNSWVGGAVVLKRVHDGWLRAEFDENHKFKVGDATKHHQIVNILYKLVKVDNVIPLRWWNSDD